MSHHPDGPAEWAKVIPINRARPSTRRTGTPWDRPAAVQASGEPAFYTVEQVAYKLSTSVAEIVAWMSTGQMPGRRGSNGRWLVSRAVLHAWINALPEADPADDPPYDGDDE
ncbi:helix-turn-helix domain-containing protein [Pseudofrankia sp. DC12]|uniref:helix-turn-helix domain-containing protein n=1 Tax=Pseudofrankia sp. DC12 TaxID=683315 RepID=UPI0005F794B1|nr:helix-turn-helix domain-containing protein [Pseudofrankia sp. DC12]